MKNRLMILALAVALLVGLVPASSAYADTEEAVVEWNNFGEYWIAQGNAIENLPFEYDADKLYMYLKDNSTEYIVVWSPGQEIANVVQPYYSYNEFYFWKSSSVSCDIYRNISSAGWDSIYTSIESYIKLTKSQVIVMYCDIDLMYSGSYSDYIFAHRTRTGENVSFQFALADMTDDLKATLQSYDNYVVARIPYRVNDWQSEQIMIAVSNGSRLILRDEAYNQIFFTTGSGYEAGLSYIYCAECCKWYQFNSSKGYILGDTVAVGGATPEVLWSSCDIYYEEGISYGLTSEVWQEVIPYTDGTDEEPEQEELVTDGFPRLFEVKSSVGYIYERASLNSSILLAVVSGKSGLVNGIEYDSDNVPWYKVAVNYNGNSVEGYILVDNIEVSYSVPTVGGSDVTNTPIPTTTPSFGDTDINIEDISGLKVVLEEIVAMVTVVPLMIGAVFSFLPTWCLAIVGASFAFLCVYLVIKLIRG